MDYQEFNTEMNTHYYRANCYHTMRDPDKDATSGNHHVINATYHLISKKLNPDYRYGNVQHDNDLDRFHTFTALTTAKERGLYNRHPDKADQPQTQDDYIGLSVSSNILDKWISYWIYSYGLNHNWYFDNLQKPTELKTKWNYWHGRFPNWISVYKRADGHKIGILNRVGFCAGIFWDVFFNKNRTDTSGRILQWLANSVMRGESKMVNYCIDKWEQKIKEDYPSGWMGEVLGIYHGIDHPFAQSMWKKM